MRNFLPLFFAVSTACEPCEPRELWFELGAASPTGFRPFAEVDHGLRIARGPQGGEHLELAVRVRGVPHGSWGNELLLEGLHEGEPIAWGHDPLYFRCDAQAPFDEAGFVFLIFDLDPWGLVGEEIEVLAELSTEDGRRADGGATIRIAP